MANGFDPIFGGDPGFPRDEEEQAKRDREIREQQKKRLQERQTDPLAQVVRDPTDERNVLQGLFGFARQQARETQAQRQELQPGRTAALGRLTGRVLEGPTDIFSGFLAQGGQRAPGDITAAVQPRGDQVAQSIAAQNRLASSLARQQRTGQPITGLSDAPLQGFPGFPQEATAGGELPDQPGGGAGEKPESGAETGDTLREGFEQRREEQERQRDRARGALAGEKPEG